MGEVAEVREGDEADVVEVVGVIRAGDELFPEAEEGGAAGHGLVDGVVALGDDGGVGHGGVRLVNGLPEAERIKPKWAC